MCVCVCVCVCVLLAVLMKCIEKLLSLSCKTFRGSMFHYFLISTLSVFARSMSLLQTIK